jgi:cytochrome b subunit of formate dehydrogenase
MAGVAIMLAIWAHQNVPNRRDVEYIKAGGPLGSRHVRRASSMRGRRGLYWLVVLGGIAVSVSGLLLMAPGLLDNVIGQQWSHIVHGLVAFAMIATIIGHAYIGSIGWRARSRRCATARWTRTGRASTTICGWRRSCGMRAGGRAGARGGGGVGWRSNF